MESFLQIISSYPTLPLTVLLGVVVCYWIFALVTGAAFDGADGAADAVAGGVKGAGDAVAGGVKAAADAVAGGVKGVGDAVAGGVKAAGDAVAGGVKGAADAVAGGVKGAGEAVHDAGDGGLLTLLGLGRVPVTITASAAALLAWTLCALGTLWLAPANGLAATAVLLGSSVAGLLGAAAVLRPFGKALAQSRPARRRDVLGSVCTITSGRVDGAFGTAHVGDGGAGLNINVVCARPNQLKKGDRAVLVDFDASRECYEVEPVDWLLPQELEALQDPARAAQVMSSRVRRH